MRRIATAALLAAPLLLGTAGTAAANNGPCTFGLGCGGTCLRLFPHIHQHGPLFNYGPYYGYPPFEPYGYWNAYLHYTGPVPPPAAGAGPGAYGWLHGGHSHTFGGGYPHPLGGVFHHGAKGVAGCSTCGGAHGHGHKSGCSSCGSVAATYLNTGNVLDRYTGVGSPAASVAYYADSPGSVITVGYTGR
ncbi:MAG: hypothetical protein JWO38_6907 [Gemmataceae bacterium]|nr:hypothetical protein [Gemmataceae bacterium]